jgi:hypothetical protein
MLGAQSPDTRIVAFWIWIWINRILFVFRGWGRPVEWGKVGMGEWGRIKGMRYRNRITCHSDHGDDERT